MINENLNKLNDKQKEAILQTDGPLLILAGAGSGKTTVLTNKIAYLIENGVNPYNIIAITFTNKAAKEMKERICNITPYGENIWISTFHSSCVRILRLHIDKIGFTNDFSIYDPEDCEKIIKEILKSYQINDSYLTPRSILYEISRQKDKLIDADKYAIKNQFDFRKKNITEVYTAYENKLKANNALDFDDLIFKTVQLFLNNPDILEKYQEKFKYILVDEYQDTSYSQYTLIKLLADKYKNLSVVGDDDQSIYGWRGADINNILDFEKDFTNTKVIKLEQNYRSTQNILNMANEVIKNNFARKAKSLWTDNDKGELISYSSCYSDKEEAMFIIKYIKKLVEEEGKSYNDFAILYRANNLTRVLEEYLLQNSVPYKIYGSINFYSRREIKDILAYLKIIQNPADDIAIKRIINVPRRSIGDTTILKIENHANQNNCSFFDAIKNCTSIDSLGKKEKILVNFNALMEDFINYSKENKVSDLIKYVFEKSLYKEELLKENTEESENRIKNIEELISKAVDFEETEEDISLKNFLENVALIADIDSLNGSDNFVTLMTLHASKGLEFPYVFIAAFEEGIFPSFRALSSENALAIEEERRLLYVGITRAKKKLFLTSAKSRLQNGRYLSNSPSSFFKELPKELLDIIKREANINTLKAANSIKPKTNYKPNIPSIKQLPSPKNISLDFNVGDTVSHFKFKNGTVLNISPAGADFEITIQFEDSGVKKLMANLSNLKKI